MWNNRNKRIHISLIMWLISLNGLGFDHDTIFFGGARPCFARGEGTRGGNPPPFIWAVISLQLLFFSAKQ